MRNAVSSPSFDAAQPWAASCIVIANKTGITQMDARNRISSMFT